MNFKTAIDIYWQELILLLACMVIVLYQIPYINRPFYWDEAWSYATGVKTMLEKGPSLIPGAIDPYLYRGHPTFFYFITVIWMKVFGSSPLAVQIFFVLISISALVVVFKIGQELHSKTSGLFAALGLATCPLFLAQATFMLPEMMLALLSLLTLLFFIKGKLLFEIICGTLLVYTKETGMVLIGAIVFYDVIMHINRSKHFVDFFRNAWRTAFHLIPILLVGIFFVIQKAKFGWFLYPEHINLITSDFKVIWNKFFEINRYVFWLEERSVMSIALFVALIISVVLKRLKGRNTKYLILLSVFMLYYILFSAVNFYTIRYSLSILPVYFILLSVIVCSLFNKRPQFALVLAGLLLVLNIRATSKSSSLGDETLNFMYMVNVHQEAIKFCEEQGMQEEPIATHFLMLYNLKDPFMGYLSGERPFKAVGHIDKIATSNIVIASNIELSEELKQVREDSRFELLKRFESGFAWCEVYSRVKELNSE